MNTSNLNTFIQLNEIYNNFKSRYPNLNVDQYLIEIKNNYLKYYKTYNYPDFLFKKFTSNSNNIIYVLGLTSNLLLHIWNNKNKQSQFYSPKLFLNFINDGSIKFL